MRWLSISEDLCCVSAEKTHFIAILTAGNFGPFCGWRWVTHRVFSYQRPRRVIGQSTQWFSFIWIALCDLSHTENGHRLIKPRVYNTESIRIKKTTIIYVKDAFCTRGKWSQRFRNKSSNLMAGEKCSYSFIPNKKILSHNLLTVFQVFAL